MENSLKQPISVFNEMDSDMEDSGMAQGEIVSCLNHWKNKYLILKKEAKP